MTDEDRALPAALAEAHALPWCADHEGYDFQPEDDFDWSVETTEWWHAWLNNPDAGPAPFRVFGRDGSGGVAAFWVRDPAAALTTQPIVFLGSEGERAVIAADLNDYLWLLAHGVGPLEPVDGINRTPQPVPGLVALARRRTATDSRSLKSVLDGAAAELPALETFIDALSR